VIVPPAENPEQQLSDKPPLRDDTRFAAGKIAIFQYATVIIFLFLISGFWSIQVRNPDFYSERAELNRIKAIPIVAPRGTPSDIVKRLNHEISDYLKSSPELGARFAKVGLGISSAGSPEGLMQFITSAKERWREQRERSEDESGRRPP
jgi:hypothetical protein